jgi:hypothetical protein
VQARRERNRYVRRAWLLGLFLSACGSGAVDIPDEVGYSFVPPMPDVSGTYQGNLHWDLVSSGPARFAEGTGTLTVTQNGASLAVVGTIRFFDRDNPVSFNCNLTFCGENCWFWAISGCTGKGSDIWGGRKCGVVPARSHDLSAGVYGHSLTYQERLGTTSCGMGDAMISGELRR